jgi:DNA (cytosine-5)-methyltransferase 1
VLDAQYWGVPQRRRRIFLVADFGGQSAPEILFKRKGLSRHLTESGEARERASTNVERSITYSIQGSMIGRAEKNGPQGDEINEDICFTLNTTDRHAIAIDSNCQDSRFKLTGDISPTIPAKMGTGGNNGPMLAIPINDQATHTNGYSNGSMIGNPGEPMYSLTAQDKHSVAVLPFDTTQITSPQNGNNPKYGDPCHPLAAGAHPPAIINCQPSGISGTVSSKWAKGTGGPAGDEHYNLICSVDCRNFNETEMHGTLQAKENGGQSLNYMGAVRTGYSVRRLTPLECERLQGFPDGWTDIPGQTEATQEELEFWRDVWLTWDKTRAEDPDKVKPRTDKAILKWLKNPVSDSAQYKALGNSVAVPCPEYVLEGIKEVLEVAHEK